MTHGAVDEGRSCGASYSSSARKPCYLLCLTLACLVQVISFTAIETGASNSMNWKRGLGLLAALAAPACSSEPDTNTKPPILQPERAVAGPRVQLSMVEETAQTITVDLVRHEADDVYGMAFRLSFPPAALVLNEVRASSAWGAAIVKAAAVDPGTIAGVVTRSGEASALEKSVTTLARVSFTKTTDRGLEYLKFVPARSALQRESGVLVSDIAWVGLERK